ncbi:hypothetical protein [Longitalea arenae]|uniref:hypothetical protein n=1 Tax=Longitalea arenae TaxID=2812558 RepID=UPI00196817EA|nr:hypothetical protein [Longitalea arenae]
MIPIEFDPLMQLSNKKGNKAPERFILRMDPRTVATDFVSQSCIRARGLLISPKAYEVISTFNIQPDHEVYQVKIEHKDKVMDYIWLNPTKDYETAIHYEKTVFSKYDFLNETTKEFRATNAKDLAGQLLDDTNPGRIFCRKIFLNDKSLFELDLFLMYFGVDEILISKALHKSLLAAKLKGFEVNREHVLFGYEGN